MSLKNRAEEVEKGWGKEIVIANTDEYCGKILEFRSESQCSMHFHIEKQETWYVLEGAFVLTYINTYNANREREFLQPGDTFTVERGIPHQLRSVTGGKIIEVSTKHHDHDSYRVERGDSQQ